MDLHPPAVPTQSIQGGPQSCQFQGARMCCHSHPPYELQSSLLTPADSSPSPVAQLCCLNVFIVMNTTHYRNTLSCQADPANPPTKQQ